MTPYKDCCVRFRLRQNIFMMIHAMKSSINSFEMIQDSQITALNNLDRIHAKGGRVAAKILTLSYKGFVVDHQIDSLEQDYQLQRVEKEHWSILV